MRDPDGEEPDDFAAARGSARQGEVRTLVASGRVSSICRLTESQYTFSALGEGWHV